MKALNGQVAIVTGGGSGIGEVTARMLAAEGALELVNDVGLHSRGPAPLFQIRLPRVLAALAGGR
jgi:NAD(P)-dependent dehydrogenase (short-subunit alcohol dehydrogenase family)